MDFFESQQAARKRTRVLVFYFPGAVVVTVLAVYLFIALLIFLLTHFDAARWYLQIFAWVAGAAFTLIGLGSLNKIVSLSAGGEVVAHMLGGRPLSTIAKDLDERVLLNVVEEISIASGVPVPPVYLLDDEPGINAFAAGFTPNDAVIGVTRGSIEMLSRDELQGVIAHEFSHILNGDMRLNIRLMGVLHGILMINLMGKKVFTSAYHPAKLLGAIGALLGVGLIAIGSVGAFFGRLIKAGVSRQREFLADAAAVQFTRNPEGLAGALKKIGGHGSRLTNPHAEQASHLFIGNACGPQRDRRTAVRSRKPTLLSAFLDLLSTHPPLEDRIRRLDPSFSGMFPHVSRVSRTEDELCGPRHARAEDELVQSIRNRTIGKQTDARVPTFAFQPAQAVVLFIVFLIVGGSGGTFYVSRGYSQARSEIERMGGEYVQLYRFGHGGRIELGPYRSVSFAEKPVTDDELRRVVPLLPFLTRRRLALDLTATQVTDSGIESLRGAKNLCFLSLGATRITDAGVANLADCSNLEYLNLWSTPVGDESFKTVGQLPRLRCLILGRTGITEAGVARLREALPGVVIDY